MSYSEACSSFYMKQYKHLLRISYHNMYTNIFISPHIHMHIGAPLRDILSSRNLLASLAITERNFETAERQLREALAQARKEIGDK